MDLTERADEVSASGAAGSWRGPLDRDLDRLGDLERRSARRTGVLTGLAAAAPAATAAAVVLAVGTGSVGGPVLAVLVLVPFAAVELLAPLVEAGQRFAVVHQSAARLRQLLVAPDPVRDPAAPVGLPPTTEVVASGACVRWPGADEDAVHDLDLVVPERAHVAVVGPSGSGKSTLAAALVRFVDRRGGSVTLGGVDEAELRGEDVRTVVTWCQQDPWMAATTVRENLRLAAPDAPDERLWAALRRVRLDDWVTALPDGLDTWIGRAGQAMSGGQRQRLALARILLAGHRVVVLDEPTAHLDAPTAREVLADLLDALDDRSVVLLAHDPAEVPAGIRCMPLGSHDGPVVAAPV